MSDALTGSGRSRAATPQREAVVTVSSTLTCPHCGTAKAKTMPTDACLFFYTCSGCGVQLKPNKGDCCVFCSFGTVPCPPIQADAGASACCGPL
jgi:hypothetical protein